MKRCLLSFAALCAVSLSTAQAAQPLTAPVLASDIADRYANL
ncbi:TPA: D-alanyl-D-alanine-carboxypeptidase/endopeptidase AmpH, partial [Enterobacter hormaechei subsp. hoffmannii]|nr:D-alanyl-D-alanine-carboxypeptidase/endopeptidase AmpH [Enterobacter hormaechei subsp. hoffmannii]